MNEVIDLILLLRQEIVEGKIEFFWWEVIFFLLKRFMYSYFMCINVPREYRAGTEGGQEKVYDPL